MMRVLARRAITIAAVLLASAANASPGERDNLNACQALVDRAAQSQGSRGAATTQQDDHKLQRCRQIIREWTLRDARMSVDEQGRPLR